MSRETSLKGPSDERLFDVIVYLIAAVIILIVLYPLPTKSRQAILQNLLLNQVVRAS